MKQIKITGFQVDRNLGYLIQETTKDSTQEILAYLYGIAQFVVNDLSKKSKAQYLSKDIVLFYKETPISFRIQIQGSGPGRFQDEIDFIPKVGVAVSFPSTKEHHDVAELMNAVVESGLDLTSEQNMPAFKKPDLKTPRCLRDVRIKQDEQRTKTST